MQTIMITEGQEMPKSENRDALNEWFKCLLTDFGEASGMTVIKSFINCLGGLRINVPDMDDMQRKERDRKIRNLFTGTNYNELSLRFGLTARQVRNILDNNRRLPRKDGDVC